MAEGPGERAARGREAEVLRARRARLERLRAMGVEPFAHDFRPPGGIVASADVRARHGDLPPDRRSGERVSVAGRIVLDRDLGRLRFLVIRDRGGDLQLVCEPGRLPADVARVLGEVEVGDIVGASGEVGTTRRGELSVFVEELVLLTKTLRPLPEKWHGLRDPELQQRRRYLHLIADPGARRIATVRAAVLRAIRRELDARGFLEVETPVLQATPGGALARPFVTHHRALGADLYLRIALELYLKRLLVGGLERVYEIGRVFRNEGIDRQHNPEFTMLELYQAYGDYATMMEIVQDLVRAAALEVRGTLRFPYQGRELDLSGEWPRVTLLGEVSRAVGEEVTLERTDLHELAERHGVGTHPRWGPGKVVLELFEKLVEPGLWGPVFVLDFPREVSPLARPHRTEPGLVEHVDLIIAGMEIMPAYSELSDPDEQRRSFELQQAQKRAWGDEEAHPLDEDFLLALEHGMPPAGGLGLGIDRLVMILADLPGIRDAILFPHLRPGPAEA
ncbi:MAG TPA: lysine--tRNA ligase [Actinomycetota bacterium]|nr:lysine--tRNA ligase [Actinomycetota bacterium]